uniref:Uncharacterized protein n=1 Tax=Lactuca sativa TaxID=4236 RepID=A0A9R1V0S7_LACSA|nr:hypothetical protein LSAT_V11C700370860 [Lactuca sativa]
MISAGTVENKFTSVDLILHMLLLGKYFLHFFIENPNEYSVNFYRAYDRAAIKFRGVKALDSQEEAQSIEVLPYTNMVVGKLEWVNFLGKIKDLLKCIANNTRIIMSRKVEIENLKKLDIQQKYEDAQKKNVEFQQKNVDVQAKFEQLAQAINVINTLSEQVKTFINQ